MTYLPSLYFCVHFIKTYWNGQGTDYQAQMKGNQFFAVSIFVISVLRGWYIFYRKAFLWFKTIIFWRVPTENWKKWRNLSKNIQNAKNSIYFLRGGGFHQRLYTIYTKFSEGQGVHVKLIWKIKLKFLINNESHKLSPDKTNFRY